MSKRIFYLCLGRSFRASDPSPKIKGVVHCWRNMGYDVQHLCGGDIEKVEGEANTTNERQSYWRWYRIFPVVRRLSQYVSELRDIRHDSLALNVLSAQVNRLRPHIIWERSCQLHLSGLTVAKKADIPYVLEWKDNLLKYCTKLTYRRAHSIEQRKVEEADYIVVESEVLKDDLVEQGISINKIIVSHNAVKVDQFSRDEWKRAQVRKDLGVDGDTVLVGYLGSFAWYHDTVRLVLAAGILRKERSTKIKFLLVGSGRESCKMRRIAEKLGLLDDMLIMKPGVPPRDVPAILSALDIAVLPGSTDIICPIKIQEYMACELPVLAPDYACNAEVIDDGWNGMLFTPKDEHSLAEKISILAKDGNIRRRLGQQAREEVQRRFTWEKTWGAALEETLRRIYS